MYRFVEVNCYNEHLMVTKLTNDSEKILFFMQELLLLF